MLCFTHIQFYFLVTKQLVEKDLALASAAVSVPAPPILCDCTRKHSSRAKMVRLHALNAAAPPRQLRLWRRCGARAWWPCAPTEQVSLVNKLLLHVLTTAAPVRRSRR